MSTMPKVLFVDDEENIVMTLKSLCRKTFDVYTALDGHEALDIVKKEHIHVIVSDQRMPEMAGIELLRNVKEISPNTMRIMLTGYADFEATVGSVNAGEVFRYIYKPWENSATKKAITEAASIALKMECGSNKQSGQSSPTPGHPKEYGILVIDEDVETYEILAKLFAKRREVLFTTSCEGAMDMLETHDIGVIVSDVMVGGQDISRFIKALKEQFPAIVTIILTAFRDTGMVVGLINEGQVFRFLPKPVAPGLLRLSAETSLRYHDRCQSDDFMLARHKVKTSSDTVQIPDTIMGRLRSLRQHLAH